MWWFNGWIPPLIPLILQVSEFSYFFIVNHLANGIYPSLISSSNTVNSSVRLIIQIPGDSNSLFWTEISRTPNVYCSPENVIVLTDRLSISLGLPIRVLTRSLSLSNDADWITLHCLFVRAIVLISTEFNLLRHRSSFVFIHFPPEKAKVCDIRGNKVYTRILGELSKKLQKMVQLLFPKTPCDTNLEFIFGLWSVIGLATDPSMLHELGGCSVGNKAYNYSYVRKQGS